MKDLDELAGIYREAHDRVLDLNLDAHQIALLAVYDEGWSDGNHRAKNEPDQTGNPVKLYIVLDSVGRQMAYMGTNPTYADTLSRPQFGGTWITYSITAGHENKS